MKNLKEKIIDSTRVYEGRIVNLRLDNVQLPDDNFSKREIVEHSGGVAVIPYDNGEITLVEQFRNGADEVLLEIPAGVLEPNEEPINSARRELEEETGYKAGAIKKICQFYTSPGFCDEIIHLYLATDLTQYQQRTDSDEFINLKKIDLKEVKKKLEYGEIKDAKTIIGLQYLLRDLEKIK